MRKTLFALGLGLVLNTPVFASDDVIDQLNDRITTILTPFQNQNTVATLHFNDIESNDEQVTKFGFNAFYRKVGSQNTFEIKLDNLSYDYGDGSAPLTALKANVTVDMTKLIPQQQLNMMIPMAADIFEQIATELSTEFTTVKSVVTSTTKDEQGNYTGLSLLLSLKTDLSQIPENQEIKVSEVVLSLAIDVKTGWSINAFAVSNPANSDEDNKILKAFVDGLVSGDEDAMNEVKQLFLSIDESATELVEMNNSVKNRVQAFLAPIVKKLTS